MDATNTITPDCVALQGNPDLYGLGIRVGIYMQWFSSWILLADDSESVRSVLTTNSVFVFAIFVATVLLQSSDGAHPLEVYIMLQLALGYFFTGTLCGFALRVQLLRPYRLKRLLLSSLPTTYVETGELPAPANLTLLRRTDMGIISALKYASLPWLGALFRCSLIGSIAAYNMIFCFGIFEDSGCEFYVFLLLKQVLRGAALRILQVSACLIYAFICLPVNFLWSFTMNLTTSILVLFLVAIGTALIGPDILPSRVRITALRATRQAFPQRDLGQRLHVLSSQRSHFFWSIHTFCIGSS